jgi:thioesterase domain-containing protein
MSDALWVRGGSGSRAPLIAVNSWVQEPEHYAALAQALGDRPIFSILPPDESTGPMAVPVPMPNRVGEWVDRELDVLRSMPVEPPYHLIGWSFGGVLALEMARRLLAEGKDVAYVGLIDARRPRPNPKTVSAALWNTLGTAAQVNDPAARRAHVRHGLERYATQRRRKVKADLWRAGQRAGLISTQPPPNSFRRFTPLRSAIFRSSLNYTGGIVDFPVSLFTTLESVEKRGDAALRWAPWLRGGFQLQRLPGMHMTLFDPEYVDDLAAALRRSIEATEALYSNVRSSSPQ